PGHSLYPRTPQIDAGTGEVDDRPRTWCLRWPVTAQDLTSSPGLDVDEVESAGIRNGGILRKDIAGSAGSDVSIFDREPTGDRSVVAGHMSVQPNRQACRIALESPTREGDPSPGDRIAGRGRRKHPQATRERRRR